ncbi:hypothetical protein LINPERPRIM_LOCUS16917 [Linum perenne]
MYNPG